MHNEGAFYAPNGVTGNAAAAAEMERSERTICAKSPLKIAATAQVCAVKCSANYIIRQNVAEKSEPFNLHLTFYFLFVVRKSSFR